MVVVVIPVPTMHEHHRYRAEQEQSIGKHLDDVRRMFGDQIGYCDSQSDKQELTFDRVEQKFFPIQLLCFHIDLHRLHYNLSSRIEGRKRLLA